MDQLEGSVVPGLDIQGKKSGIRNSAASGSSGIAPRRVSTTIKRKIEHDEDFIPSEDSESDEKPLSQTTVHRPALKPRRTKRQSLDEEAWRPGDGENCHESRSNITTRAANADKYFVTPMAEDGCTQVLPGRTTSKFTRTTSRRQSRDITPKEGLLKSSPVKTLDLDTSAAVLGTRVVAEPIKPLTTWIGQPGHATNAGIVTSPDPDGMLPVISNSLSPKVFGNTTPRVAQNDAVEVEVYEDTTEQDYDSRESNVNGQDELRVTGNAFPPGVGPWDSSQLSLSMRLRYLDGEIREYDMRFLERAIEFIGSEPATSPIVSPSPWRELDIPTVAMPYLMKFFRAPVVPDLSQLQLQRVQLSAVNFGISFVELSCCNIPPLKDDSAEKLWTKVVEYCTHPTEPDILTQLVQVLFVKEWRIVPSTIPVLPDICKHATSVLAASSCPCKCERSIAQAVRLEREEYVMKWKIIYETFRWVVRLLAKGGFTHIGDGNDRNLRLQVFVEDISDDLLETVFRVLQPAVAVSNAIQLADWRCALVTVLVRLADAILMFQIAQDGGEDFDVFSKWIFVNFRHLAVGFDVSRPVELSNRLPLGCLLGPRM